MGITKRQRVPEPREGTGGDSFHGRTPTRSARSPPARAGPRRKPGQGRAGSRRPRRTAMPARKPRTSRFAEGAQQQEHTGKNVRRRAW